MTKLSEENKNLRNRVRELENALERAVFTLFPELPTSPFPMPIPIPIPGGPIPGGCDKLMAGLTVSNPAEAIKYYENTFGAREFFRVEDDNGRVIHAELQVDNTVFSVNAEHPEVGLLSPARSGHSPVTLTLRMDDAKSTFKKAMKSGAKEVLPFGEAFWGDVTGTISDPFGHTWTLSTNVNPTSYDEIKERSKKALAG